MGRLALMVQFQWARIATISSHEQYYAQVSSACDEYNIIIAGSFWLPSLCELMIIH